MSPAQTALERRASIIGQALMFVAALFWVSNPVALRYFYTPPGPPDAPVLLAAQTGLAAVILLIISHGMKAVRSRRKPSSDKDKDPCISSSDSDTQELIARDVPNFQAEVTGASEAAQRSGGRSSAKETEPVLTRKLPPRLDHLDLDVTQVALETSQDTKSHQVLTMI